MNEKLMDIACCPVTHQPLRKANRELLERLARMAAAGTLENLGGESSATAPQAALVTRDGLRVYPVRDGLVALIADQSYLLEEDR